MPRASANLRVDTLSDVTLRNSAEETWCKPEYQDDDTRTFFNSVIGSPEWKKITCRQRETTRMYDMLRPHMTHTSWAGQTEDGYHHITLQSTCGTRQVRTRAVFKDQATFPTMTVTWTNQESPTNLLYDCLHFEDNTKDVCQDNPEKWNSAAQDIVRAIYSNGYMDSEKGLIDPYSELPLSGSVYWKDENMVVGLSPPTAFRARTEKRFWTYDKTLSHLISVD